MTPRQFAAARERILSQSHTRSNDWRKRALAHLAAEARAEPQFSGKRILSWRMPTGQHVCVKHRYTSEVRAISAMGEMHRETDGRRKPVRAYPCFFCNGWHITSQA